MEAEARAFEEEKKNNPEEADDHDTRKLPKPERMRLVAKNKEVGAHHTKTQIHCLATLWVLCLAPLGRSVCRHEDSNRSYFELFREMLLLVSCICMCCD